MIPLARVRTAAIIPKDFQGAKLTAKHLDLVKRYFEAASPDEIKFDSGKWKSAKAALKADTHGKCAYCEAPTDTVAWGDVEHFRPKSSYWWLAYCFDNYLFSCQICNQGHKSDNFPVTGPKLRRPRMPADLPEDEALDRLLARLTLDPTIVTDAKIRTAWSVEDAGLPNPYIEDPSRYFFYEADDDNEEVWIRPTTHARAGAVFAACDSFLALNREELLRERYTIYSLLAVLHDSYADPRISAATKERIEAQFKRSAAPSAPFAGMSRYFLGDWGAPH